MERAVGARNFLSTGGGRVFLHVAEHGSGEPPTESHSCSHILSTAVDGLSPSLSTGCPQGMFVVASGRAYVGAVPLGKGTPGWVWVAVSVVPG